MSDPGPLSFVTTDEIVDELARRTESFTLAMVLKGDDSPVVRMVGHAYVQAFCLKAMDAALLERLFEGRQTTDEADPRDGGS